MKNLFHTVQDVLYLSKPYWKNHKKFTLSFIIICAFLPGLTTIGSILYQQTILDQLTKNKSLQDIFLSTIWILLFMYLPLIVDDLFDTLISVPTLEKIESEIKRDIYQKAKETDYVYFDTPEFYDNFAWTINERAAKANESWKIIIRFFSIIVTLFSVSSLIIMQDFIIIILNIVMLTANMYLGLAGNKLTHQQRERTLQPYRRLSYINRLFYSKEWAASIKVTNMGDKLLYDFNQAYLHIVNIIKMFSHKLALYRLLVHMLSVFDEIIVVMYLCFLVINGEITIGSFIGLITASSYLRRNLKQLFEFVQNSNQLSFFTERLKRFEQLESIIEKGKTAKATISMEDVVNGFEIEFKNVCFSYPNSNFRIDNMDFRINKGQKIAIVGENGGGKTTLTKLLVRLYDPQNGEIFINKHNINEYDITQLRQYVGIAFQDSHAYAMSFRDNMTVYNSAEDNKLEDICKEYGLDSVLKKTGGTLNSELTREFDENGILLSGGEMQKLALARLATGNFGLLVLDEPSSALDPLAEYELNKILFNKASTTTTIMISHRFSNVRDADCIYVMKSGNIVERGTHDELLSRRGYYYEMFTRQSERYIT